MEGSLARQPLSLLVQSSYLHDYSKKITLVKSKCRLLAKQPYFNQMILLTK